MWNPFSKDSGTLLAMDTKNIINDYVVKIMGGKWNQWPVCTMSFLQGVYDEFPPGVYDEFPQGCVQ